MGQRERKGNLFGALNHVISKFEQSVAHFARREHGQMRLGRLDQFAGSLAGIGDPGITLDQADDRIEIVLGEIGSGDNFLYPAAFRRSAAA
jgi:hypothetical protein